jgi:phosphatidylserine/phosphatidylglycerophosphate/cardiolipin synthase-like enzyme
MDMKSYISSFAYENQKRDYETCLQKLQAGLVKEGLCQKDYSFGPELEQSQIEVKYKAYAYRFHASYAKQLHHKFMIVDDKALFMGSYNLSDNAEHETFENVVVFRAPGYSSLIQAYRDEFDRIWKTDSKALEELKTTINSSIRPLKLQFLPVTVSGKDLADIRRAFQRACPKEVDSEEFRKAPEKNVECNH